MDRTNEYIVTKNELAIDRLRLQQAQDEITALHAVPNAFISLDDRFKNMSRISDLLRVCLALRESIFDREQTLIGIEMEAKQITSSTDRKE